MIVSRPTRATFEEHHDLETPSPDPVYGAPTGLLEPRGCGRLIAPLRDASRTRDPVEILTRAAVSLRETPRRGALEAERAMLLGKALADLAVTGRHAFERFRRAPPDQATLAGAARRRLAEAGEHPRDEGIARAVEAALDRAFAVARAVTGSPGLRRARREHLGWVAVSGEDDPPHRPVNVACAPYPQHTLRVAVHSTPVDARFFVATAAGPSGSGESGHGRELPSETAIEIPDDHEIILFLHGHSSRAEEVMDLAPPLLRAGLARGRPLAIVAVDLPSNGYSSMIEHTQVAASHETTFPVGIFERGRVGTPLLDFLEDFVVEFLIALDRVVPLAGRFAGVIGGSLGGNLGLRLGRRDNTRSPWLRAGIVSWGAASVWAPMVRDLVKGFAPRHCRSKWSQEEAEAQRREYFEDVFERVLVPVLVHHTQPSMWYRAGWEPHKTARIAQSRRDRYEVYGASFRRWHWRVAGEQLVYSHIDRVDGTVGDSPERHEHNTVRQLLLAGALDDFPGSNIYSATRELAARMKRVPGRSVFVLDTGHSIHSERPRFLAEEIARFLLDEAPVRS